MGNGGGSGGGLGILRIRIRRRRWLRCGGLCVDGFGGIVGGLGSRCIGSVRRIGRALEGRRGLSRLLGAGGGVSHRS